MLGKRIISTRLRGNVTIREENATAALEVMSRFAANPKWLIYLPPTMSPCETSTRAGLAGASGRGVRLLPHQGVPQVVCEEKHMGSRAVVDRLPGRRRPPASASASTAAKPASSTPAPAGGSSTTRTWRRSSSPGCARPCDRAGFWEEFDTDWVCLDCELMPWSAKAQELLRTQYARGRGRAGEVVRRALPVLSAGGACDPELVAQPRGVRRTRRDVGHFRRLPAVCWPVTT